MANHETPLQSPAAPAKGGTGGPALFSAFTLKCIAIVAMAVDHAAFAFVDDYYSPLGAILHFIGRITAPIMFYFVVEGYHHTQSKNRYTLRMAVFAAVSYLPFIWFHYGILPFSRLPQGSEWLTLNVIYTLLLGLLVLRVRHELTNLPRSFRGLLFLALLALSLFGDWSYIAIVSILAFDIFRGSFAKQALAFGAVVLMGFAPAASEMVTAISNGAPQQTVARYGWYLFVIAGRLVPLALLYGYSGKKGAGGKWGKWLFYVFYPLHLLVIAALQAVL